jgi:hypothetical protein
VRCRAVKKTAEERMKALFAKYSFPPLEVIIPILEKAGRGERELEAQMYDTQLALAKGIKEILGLKDKNVKTLAKVWEVMFTFGEQKFEPIELTDSRFSVSISDCPMLHVGKDVSVNVKSKFCDLICTAGSKARNNAVLDQDIGTCSWDKSLIKGSRRCKLVIELVKTK